MSKEDQKEQQRSSPHYVGYTVKDRGHGKDPFWLAIGAAWKHEDGKGMTVQLDAAPLDGRLTLREKRREHYETTRQGSGQFQSRRQEYRR